MGEGRRLGQGLTAPPEAAEAHIASAGRGDARHQGASTRGLASFSFKILNA